MTRPVVTGGDHAAKDIRSGPSFLEASVWFASASAFAFIDALGVAVDDAKIICCWLELYDFFTVQSNGDSRKH
jgi:hypothetical protein